MKKHLLEILLILGLAAAAGLARNLAFPPHLPLFGYHPPESLTAEESAMTFTEADAELVQQFVGVSSALILDARDPALFGRGHIPGAMNLPIRRFQEEYPELAERIQTASWLILYCTGYTCPDSHHLAVRLKEKGVKNILLFQGGMEEWMERDYHVEK